LCIQSRGRGTKRWGTNPLWEENTGYRGKRDDGPNCLLWVPLATQREQERKKNVGGETYFEKKKLEEGKGVTTGHRRRKNNVNHLIYAGGEGRACVEEIHFGIKRKGKKNPLTHKKKRGEIHFRKKIKRHGEKTGGG